MTRSEFDDNADLLTQLGRSRSANVRRNAIVAWKELLLQLDDQAMMRLAVDRMIDSALADGLQPNEWAEILAITSTELADVDRALHPYLRRRLRREIAINRVGEHGRHAAELTVDVMSRQLQDQWHGKMAGWSLMFRSYLALLGIAFRQWLITLRDGAAFLLVATFIAGMLAIISFTAVSGANRIRFEGSDLVPCFIFSIPFGALAAVISVPFARVGRMFAVIEAIGFSMILSILLFLAILSILYLQRDTDALSLGLAPVLALVIFVSRLTFRMLAPIRQGSRTILATIGSWMVGAAVASVIGPMLETRDQALLLVLLVFHFGAMLGAAWGDYRRSAPLPLPILKRQTGYRRYLPIAIAAGGCIWIALTIIQFGRQVDAARTNLALVARSSNVGPTVNVPCNGTEVGIPDLVLDRFYPVQVCPRKQLAAITTGRQATILGQDFLVAEKDNQWSRYQDLRGGSTTSNNVSDIVSTMYVCVGLCQVSKQSFSLRDISTAFSITWGNTSYFTEFMKGDGYPATYTDENPTIKLTIE